MEGLGFCCYENIIKGSRKLERRVPKKLRSWISVPYCILLVYIVGMGILWGAILVIVPNRNSDHIRFIDGIFNAMSAVTGSGLATVAMSSLTTFQLFVLMLLCLIGGKVFTTILELQLRVFACRRRKIVVEDIVAPYSHVMDLHESYEARNFCNDGLNIGISDRNSNKGSFRSQKIFPNEEEEPQNPAAVRIELTPSPLRRRNLGFNRPCRSDGDVLTMIRLRFKKNGVHDDNGLGSLFESQVAAVTNEEKEKSGGKDSNSESHEKVLRSLAGIVFSYWAGIQISGAVLAIIYLVATRSARLPVTGSDVNVIFFAIFMTISHFANAGFAPINASMMPFTKNLGLLFIYGGQMLLGNTMLPVALRAIIWIAAKFSGNGKRTIFKGLLTNPGRFRLSGCLYTKKQTLWLLMVIMGCIVLLISLIFGLMWNNKVMAGLSPAEKIVNSVFQAISCRHTGVNVWNLADWSPTVLYIFILIMYVPGQPVFSAQKQSNSKDDKISFQSKKFLLHYSLFVAAVVLLICIIENHNINTDPLNFSILNILFEVVSGFMNVGLSVGYSCSLNTSSSGGSSCVDVPYSFSGKWSSASKFLLIVAMVVGRLC